MDMHRTELTETFSDSDLGEFLEHSKELLLTVDEIIEVTPLKCHRLFRRKNSKVKPSFPDCFFC